MWMRFSDLKDLQGSRCGAVVAVALWWRRTGAAAAGCARCRNCGLLHPIGDETIAEHWGYGVYC